MTKPKDIAPEEWSRRCRERALKVRYGITVEQYNQMLADQRGVCAICGRTCATGQYLAVDHDHETGQVRGLLCFACNVGLGWYEQYQEKFAVYLREE